MGPGNSQVWLLALCIVAGAAISGSLYAAYLMWRKRSVDEEPLPHCNLEERLSQIAKASMQPVKKTA
jgi:hypothetical protein